MDRISKSIIIIFYKKLKNDCFFIQQFVGRENALLMQYLSLAFKTFVTT